MIVFGQKQLRDIEFSSSKEWILTDGDGGFASSTISFMNTRRQHSLLTVSLNPPLRRLALLNKVDEEVIVNGKSYFLGTNQYPGTLFPQGYKYLHKFTFDHFPQLSFDLDGNLLSKKVVMPKHSNSVFIHYENDSKVELTFRLLPLLSFRLKDSLLHAGDGFLVDELPDGVRIVADMNLPRVYLKLSRIYNTSPESFWYRDFIYKNDGGNYDDSREDLYNIGYWETILEPGKSVTLAASTRDLGEFDYSEIEAKYVEAIEAVRSRSGLSKKYIRLADMGSCHFVRSHAVRGSVVLEGYPYGSIMIRDTLLSLAGLSWISGESKPEHNILHNLVTNKMNGVLPASVDESDQHINYDDPMVPFYFAVALTRSTAKEEGASLLRRFMPVLKESADMILENNLGGKKLGATGLIVLTGGSDIAAANPSNACINALLYNLLRLISDSDSSEGARYTEIISQIESGFFSTFYEPDGRYKNIVDHGQVTLNMAMPLVMTFSPLDEDQQVAISRNLVEIFLQTRNEESIHTGMDHSCNLVGMYLTEATSKFKSCGQEFERMLVFFEDLVSNQDLTNCVDGIQKCGTDSMRERPQDISSAIMVAEAIRLVKDLKLK